MSTKPCPRCGLDMVPNLDTGRWECPGVVPVPGVEWSKCPPCGSNEPLAADAEARLRGAPTLPGFGE